MYVSPHLPFLPSTLADLPLADLPDGNSKFSTFEVDTRTANEPVVRVKVWIDGAEAWQVEVRGKPLDIPAPPSAIGSLGKSLLELLGFKVSFFTLIRRRWRESSLSE